MEQRVGIVVYATDAIGNVHAKQKFSGSHMSDMARSAEEMALKLGFNVSSEYFYSLAEFITA